MGEIGWMIQFSSLSLVSPSWTTVGFWLNEDCLKHLQSLQILLYRSTVMFLEGQPGTEMRWWFFFSRPELCTLPYKLELERWQYVLLLQQGKEIMGTESTVLFLTKLYSSSHKRSREAGMDWFLTLFSVDKIHAPYQLLNSRTIFLNGTVSRSSSTVIGLSRAVLGHGTGHHHTECCPSSRWQLKTAHLATACHDCLLTGMTGECRFMTALLRAMISLI